MISYFQNEQGDYTITQNDTPIAWVTNETQAILIKSVFEADAKQVKELHAEIQKLKHEAFKADQKHENMKEVMKQMGERFHSKLMSVYYLLGAIKTMGTHHEKEVAIRYLQQTVDNLVKDQDGLSWDQNLFNLPF